MDIEELRDIDIFRGIGDDNLICVAEIEATRRLLKPNDILFREGDKAHCFYLILKGKMMVYRVIRGQRLPITYFKAGDSGGEVPLLLGQAHLGNGVILEDFEVLELPTDQFWRLLGLCPHVRERIMHNMRERQSQLEVMSNQREKLAALGTLSAGLAHELNNPASAAKRAAFTLEQTLGEFNRQATELMQGVMFKEDLPEEEYRFQELEDRITIEGLEIDPIERNELEDDLAEWFEQLDVDDPWGMADTFVSVGMSRDFLEPYVERLKPEHVNTCINWTHKDIELRLLSNELNLSTTRISELVSALRDYSYMDTSLEQHPTDVHEGISNTLTILNHKLKKKQIVVTKAFDQELPEIPAFGSELNQVWTNILDNAIDAVEDGGHIKISTAKDTAQNRIFIDIEDDGSGIPADDLDLIFDPFFTTKPMGQGTGLGLEISYRIVVNQHKGAILVDSEPGRTRFRVCLPVDHVCNIG